MQNLIISSYNIAEKGQPANVQLFKPLTNGGIRICVKYTHAPKNNPAYLSANRPKPRILTAFIAIDPSMVDSIKDRLVEGADFNTITPDPLHIYTQLSFQPFSTGQESAKKKDAAGNLVTSFKDGKEYYAKIAVAYADEENRMRVWGSVSSYNAKGYGVFTANPIGVVATAPAVQTTVAAAEGEF